MVPTLLRMSTGAVERYGTNKKSPPQDKQPRTSQMIRIEIKIMRKGENWGINKPLPQVQHSN